MVWRCCNYRGVYFGEFLDLAADKSFVSIAQLDRRARSDGRNVLPERLSAVLVESHLGDHRSRGDHQSDQGYLIKFV